MPLRHVFSIATGATPSSEKDEYWDGKILWITPEDLSDRDSYWLADTRRKITRSGYEVSATTKAPANSIVLSKRAPIGQLAILRQPACSNQGCFLLIPRIEIDSRFFYYYLRHRTKYLQNLGSGSTFAELGMEDLKSMRVPIISIVQQRAIADYLDQETARIDGLAAQMRTTIDLLRERRTSVISAAVEGRVDLGRVA